jgi:hypothetical protein
MGDAGDAYSVASRDNNSRNDLGVIESPAIHLDCGACFYIGYSQPGTEPLLVLLRRGIRSALYPRWYWDSDEYESMLCVG